MTSTRLDRVVRFREEEEERAEQALAVAIRGVETARETLRLAEENLLREDQREATAGLRSIAELARVRLQIAVRRATEALAGALKEEERVRRQHLDARQRAESLRRAADSRRDELRVEGERLERREHDAVGALIAARRVRPGA